MFSSAEKTKPVTVQRQQQAAGPAFFRKAGETTFSGSEKQSSFFSPVIQTKLSVSSPDDPQEKEADAVADKVMRMPDPVSVQSKEEKKLDRKEEQEENIQAKRQSPVITINRKCDHCDKEEKTQPKLLRMIYRKANTAEEEADTPVQAKQISLHRLDIFKQSGRGPPVNSPQSSFEQSLSSSKGGGEPMHPSTQQFMESRFNADFSGIRIHTGSDAQSLSSNINAQAFTHGNDIYFNSGKYAPHTEGGSTLLAHELTHTIQQGASPAGTSSVSKKAIPSSSNNLSGKEQQHSVPPAVIHRSIIDESFLSQIDLSARSGGHQLSKEAREYLEGYYNTDLGDIRIHSDNEISTICKATGVNAFVEGKDIAIVPSRLNMDTEEGAVLLSEQVAKSLKQRGIRAVAKDGNNAGEVPSLLSQIREAVADNKAEQAAAVQVKKAPAPPIAPVKDKKAGGKKNGTAGSKKAAGSRQKGKKKGKSGDGPVIKPVKLKKGRSPAKPAEDPAFLKVVSKTKTTSKNQKQHEPAEKKSADAQNSAEAVPKEAEGKAQNRKTDGMGAAAAEDKPFDAVSFKAELLKKIEEITPKNLKEASDFKNNNKIDKVKASVNEKVESGKQTTTGPVDTATAQPLQVNPADNKQPVPLPPTQAGARPAGPGAKDAVPKNKTGEEISMQEQSKSLDEEMKANNVSEQQLKSSNEPSFAQALTEKQKAQKDAVEKPKQYQKEEATELAAAKAAATEDASKTISVMHGARGKNFAASVQQQQTSKQKDEDARAKVIGEIERLYGIAEKTVNDALKAADDQSNSLFDTGAEEARQQFEKYVGDKMAAYKADRYSGFWGGLRWAKDKLFGMPDAVNRFYTEGRQLYLDKMDQVITKVAEVVTQKLNEAKQAIKDGKKAIDDYITTLPKDQQTIGNEAKESIQDKFDSLEQSVNDKRDGLIEGLAKKYVDNVKKLDERIEALKEANKGLVDKAIGFLKKIWQVIKDLTNLFTTILARLAAIIGTILSSPGGFFDNLGKAFKKGFNNFKDKFLDYLEKGLMEWLVTNLGIGHIELPEKFSAGAILSLVLQVMGITKEHIRERAVGILGERKVALLENAGGLLFKIYNEGLGALWDLIVEKITDFKDIIWEAIKSFIKTKIIEAAITFLLSLLNPIGAFIKVCMAIYDFLMMLVRFKDKIVELLDTILGAVTDIASGAIDGAANAIEKAFAKSIPIIIAFLAALLHLNDIAAKVKGIIMKIRARIDKAIDFAITKAWSFIGKGVEGILSIEDKGRAMVEKGKEKLTQAGKAAAAKVTGWVKHIIGMEKRFKGEDGSDHRVYFAAKGTEAELMINPAPAGKYETWLMNIEIDTSTDAGRKREQKRKQALSKAKDIDKEEHVGVDENDARAADKQEDKIRKLLDELSALTGPLFAGQKPDCSSVAENGLNFSPLAGGYGKGMMAKTLTNIKMPGGSEPSVKGHSPFNIINQRRNQGGSYYVLGHLLNHNLGGTGKEWKNLTPLTRQANSKHESIAEARVKNAVDAGNIVYYKVEAVYGRTAPKHPDPVIQEIMKAETSVPQHLECEAEMITPAAMSGSGSDKKVTLVPKKTIIENKISQDAKDYDLTGIKREDIYLDTANATALKAIEGFDESLAKMIVSAWKDKYKADKTRFSSFEDLAGYVFADGTKFTGPQKTAIMKAKTLSYVKLYKGG